MRMAIAENWSTILTVRRRWIIHFFFWAFVLVLYSLLFGNKSNDFSHTLFFVTLLMPVTIGSTYFLNYFLLPTYLMQGRYLEFVVYFIYTLLGAIFLEMWVTVLTFIVVAELNIKDMSPGSINFPFLMAALLMIVFLGVSLKMLSHWQKSKEEYQQLMNDKVEAELRFLKTQLNPHFLFNTLNNLYFLSIEKSDQTPKAILALSEMLDYVLHESKSVLVSLSKEIKELKNYISLESMRYEDRIEIEIVVEGDTEKPRIAPMMLITLVENAFKHGVMKTAGKSFIKIDIVSEREFFKAKVSNSWKKNISESGIGLTNIKDQLRILFPNKHSLTVDGSKEDVFSVVLTIQQP